MERTRMTKDEIIEMARQSGIDIGMWEKLSDNDDVFGYDFCGIHENLEDFAKMVAEHEREECAKRLEAVGAAHCAENIRARGNHD
jgi:hypothetical protein